jgi:hypothetical protein
MIDNILFRPFLANMLNMRLPKHAGTTPQDSAAFVDLAASRGIIRSASRLDKLLSSLLIQLEHAHDGRIVFFRCSVLFATLQIDVGIIPKMKHQCAIALNTLSHCGILV